MAAVQVSLPNFTEGREGTAVDRIVIHYIVGTLAAADTTFSDPNSGVSAHYGIGEGEIHQFVDEANTAWHAGDWNFNLRSIGIEHSADPSRTRAGTTSQAKWVPGSAATTSDVVVHSRSGVRLWPVKVAPTSCIPGPSQSHR